MDERALDPSHATDATDARDHATTTDRTATETTTTTTATTATTATTTVCADARERPMDQQAPAWWCPVCTRPVPRPHRPGRARVYCTNACRQRAYRWRCRHRARLVTPSPPYRARTYDRTHALRSDADLVTPLSDADGRRVTACGTFAKAARDAPRRYRHLWFYGFTEIDRRTGAVTEPDTTCRRCVDLLGVERRPIEQVLAELERADGRQRSTRRYSRNRRKS